MKRPLVTLYCVVSGSVYERYAEQLLQDAQEHWFPGVSELVVLPGSPARRDTPALWSHVSATRYSVALNHLEHLRGEWIFQVDADMRIVAPIGREILSDGITTSLHPGVPVGQPPDKWPYERDPASRAYVPYGGEGKQYHPGCFVGGRRDRFVELAETVARGVDQDLADGIFPAWYEEAHLNKYFVENTADLVLPREFCWWAFWTPNGEYAAAGAKLVHLDKSAEEFENRG